MNMLRIKQRERDLWNNQVIDLDFYERGEIAVTANRSDEEPWRLERLQRVIGYVSCMRPSVWRKVAGLHDHKGFLTVTWWEPPTEPDQRYFTRAWESIIGDGCANVTHKLVELEVLET